MMYVVIDDNNADVVVYSFQQLLSRLAQGEKLRIFGYTDDYIQLSILVAQAKEC